jgi:hypothetical protein
MLDTTPVTIAITRLISTGTTEQALLVAVARAFPELTQRSCRRPCRSRPQGRSVQRRGAIRHNACQLCAP